MAVCGPLFTAYVGDSWFATLHALRQRVEEAGRLTFLLVTLTGQPTTYHFPDAAGVVRSWGAVPFE